MYDIFQVIHDKTGKLLATYYENKPIEFEWRNKIWCGIFKTVNRFYATEEELEKSWWKTRRQKCFLKKLRYIYCDFDIWKKWDWQTEDEKKAKKAKWYRDLVNKCEPSMIIETWNWLQPLRRINEDGIDEETQDIYRRVIEWINNWSKTVWALWDDVKDVTRILRVPWYYHMKWDPIMVLKHEWVNDMTYTLFDLYKAFSEYIPSPKVIKTVERKPYEIKEWQFNLDSIDIRDIFEKLLQSQWRSLQFDRTARAIIDWRLTWTFQWKTGDKQFIASNSHDPYRWNKITLVSSTLWITWPEAYIRIKEQFTF